MLKFKKIPVELLAELLESERNGVDDVDFVERFIQGTIKTLKSKPLAYRSFGAYWWPIKRLIVNAKVYHNDFGDSYDTELNEAFSYDSDAITVCAAFLEQEANISEGNMMATVFNYEDEDGQNISLTVHDDVMEKIAYLLNAS